VFAVAALDNFEAWAVQAQRALGHEQNALLIIFSQTATGSEAGRLFSSGGIVSSSGFLAGWKAPGAASRDSRMQNRAHQAEPEDVTFGAKGGVSQILLFARARVFDDPRQSEFRVFRCLREAAGEIVEAAGERGIVFAQAIHAQNNQFLRE